MTSGDRTDDLADDPADDLALRTLGPGDEALLPRLVELQVRMAEETEGLALDREVVARGMAAVLADPAKGEYLIAVEPGEEDDDAEGADDGGEGGERLVGMLLVTPEWSDWRAATVLWVQSVYVVPEARGRGIYRRLYQHLQQRVASDPDLGGLRLYVDRRNEPAQDVYRKLGMSREHYEMFEWMKETDEEPEPN